MADARQHSAQARALVLSKAIMRRDDVRVRKLIEGFAGALDYQGYGLEELGWGWAPAAARSFVGRGAVMV